MAKVNQFYFLKLHHRQYRRALIIIFPLGKYLSREYLSPYLAEIVFLHKKVVKIKTVNWDATEGELPYRSYGDARCLS